MARSNPWPVLGLATSIGLAIVAQTALLRTRGALPAVPLFLAACGLGGWAALRAAAAGPGLAFVSFRSLPRAWDWKGTLVLSAACNAICLVLFGRNLQPNLAWLLFATSVVLAGLAFWLLDGRPALGLKWREERGWLVALAVLVTTGAVLRLIWLGHVPAGLWFDEAADTGLEIRHMLIDPNYRPVFGVQPELWRYPALPAFVLFGANAFAIRLPHALAGIAGIAAIYFAGRELYGRKVGLLAAAILTALVWHVTFSRIAFSAVMSVTLDALAMFLLVRAIRTKSWLAAGLCGACIGIGVQVYYTSRFMALVLAVLSGLVWLRAPRSNLRSAALVVVGALLMGLLCASPLLEFAIRHPVQFNARVSTLSVLNEVQTSHSIRPLTDNLRAHLLMFNLAGDRNGRHNMPGAPELNFLLGGLFVLGLGMTAARARRPEFLVLLVWGVAMLAGGVLSVSFEAPQSLRTFDEVNVVALACALPLALLWENLEQALAAVGFWRPPWLMMCASAPVVFLIGVSGYTDIDRYFQKQERNPAVFSDSSGAPTLLAQQANALPPGTRVYMSEQLVGQPTISFLAPAVKQTPFSTAQLPLTDAKGTAIFLLGDESPTVDVVRTFYAGVSITPLTGPFGGPVLLYAVRLGADTIDAAHSVAGAYQPARGGEAHRVGPDFELRWDSPPVPFPFDASWRAVVKAPEYGTYQFLVNGPPGAQLQIDGETLSAVGQPAGVRLAQGLHAIVLTASIASDRDAISVLWQPPSARGFSVLPREMLFGPPITANGLVGAYFKGDSWSGAPAFERIDPEVGFRFHLVPIPPPFSIEWSGTLAAPTSGSYHVGTSAIDSSQLFIDGQQIVDNGTANEYHEASVTLNAGLHGIRLRYEGHTGNFRVELDWQPPGGVREPIPSRYLFPSHSAAVGGLQLSI